MIGEEFNKIADIFKRTIVWEKGRERKPIEKEEDEEEEEKAEYRNLYHILCISEMGERRMRKTKQIVESTAVSHIQYTWWLFMWIYGYDNNALRFYYVFSRLEFLQWVNFVEEEKYPKHLCFVNDEM